MNSKHSNDDDPRSLSRLIYSKAGMVTFLLQVSAIRRQSQLNRVNIWSLLKKLSHLYTTLTTTIPEVAEPAKYNEIINIEIRSPSPSLPPRLTSTKLNPHTVPSSTITISRRVRPRRPSPYVARMHAICRR